MFVQKDLKKVAIIDTMVMMKNIKMKDNPTIIKFKCVKCGKEVEMQTVYTLLIEECDECLYGGLINKNESG